MEPGSAGWTRSWEDVNLGLGSITNKLHDLRHDTKFPDPEFSLKSHRNNSPYPGHPEIILITNIRRLEKEVGEEEK